MILFIILMICCLFVLAFVRQSYNRLIEMKVIMKFFESELDKFLNLENFIDCKIPPQKLLRQLKATDGKKLIKVLETNTSNPFKIIRILSIANLILIYSKNWFEVIEQTLKQKLTKDQWINKKFLEPYYHFIIKCCTSKDAYNQSKNLTIKKSETMQNLFYSVNMLRLLFKVVQKMPLIGRYYKSKNNQVISSAIEIIALQAQRLYNSFKCSISQILLNHTYYIKDRKDQDIMRGILSDELTYINQQMKKLFLDKYFYPLGKGITVKLFKPQEHSAEVEQTFNSIISNHEQTQRQKRKDELQCTLFPGSGLVNWNFYEQTLLAGPLLNVTNQPSTFVELDDIVISQEDEKVQQIPVYQSNVKKQQSQKETNTGTLQIKGGQM